ncbi:MAG: IDEAL domain-containing protein [Bacillus sp. (in: Bacteria)]|nr:IDEAL domain-containing protein [Bacillus sp. (in: firmicutes)]
MKKLSCKYCGNGEFYVLNLQETMCKCGYKLTKLSDYRMVESQTEKNSLLHTNDQQKAEVIAKISLLKSEIDKCLDDRNKKRFETLSLELKVLQNFLEKEVSNPEFRLQEMLMQIQNKF